jgi:hypothetical protein
MTIWLAACHMWNRYCLRYGPPPSHWVSCCAFPGSVQSGPLSLQTEEAQSRPGLFHLTAAGVLLWPPRRSWYVPNPYRPDPCRGQDTEGLLMVAGWKIELVVGGSQNHKLNVLSTLTTVGRSMVARLAGWCEWEGLWEGRWSDSCKQRQRYVLARIYQP